MKSLRRKLHAEIKALDAAFDKHLKKGAALSSCRVCNAYQNRTVALIHAIKLAGGQDLTDGHTLTDESTF